MSTWFCAAAAVVAVLVSVLVFGFVTIFTVFAGGAGVVSDGFAFTDDRFV